MVCHRFGIEMITEFYGSTEGNANAINSYNVIGCVGFTSMIVPSFHPISVILVDKETGMPLRGSCYFLSDIIGSVVPYEAFCITHPHGLGLQIGNDYWKS